MEQGTKALKNLSNVAKIYVRISYIKTALTVFLVGYTAIKAFQTFRDDE